MNPERWPFPQSWLHELDPSIDVVLPTPPPSRRYASDLSHRVQRAVRIANTDRKGTAAAARTMQNTQASLNCVACPVAESMPRAREAAGA